ncbi:MAG: hypothetical protein L0215_09100 [Gemmataceae bacterium]|nr:hypothetical protein [Gemmataceae bacterium]
MLGLFPLALLALGWIGCARGPTPMTPVSGKVTYKGAPVPGGAIVFTPDTTRGETGRIAHGKINSDGSFQLYTGETLGVGAGWYRVTVTSFATASLLPDKYRDPDLSRLACEIKPNRSNSIDFNLD